MPLENDEVVDAVGIENRTGAVVLTLMDSWDWAEPEVHLQALQRKLNAYFAFIESGELLKQYPKANGRKIVIALVTRFAPPLSSVQLLAQAAHASTQLGAEFRTQHVP